MWIELILLVILLYILGGLPRIVSDVAKPSFDRPLYSRNPILILFTLVAWLPLRIMQIKKTGIKRLWQIERESKFLENFAETRRRLIKEVMKQAAIRKIKREDVESLRKLEEEHKKLFGIEKKTDIEKWIDKLKKKNKINL